MIKVEVAQSLLTGNTIEFHFDEDLLDGIDELSQEELFELSFLGGDENDE